MFTICLEEITEKGLEVSWEESQSSLDSYLEHLPSIDFRFATPLRANAMVRKVGRSLMIKGDVWTTLELTCVRCLEAFPFPVSSRFDLTLFPSGESVEEREVELEEEDMDSDFYEGGEIRLSEIACEQVFLELPYKPLCSEQCKGLCPMCGENMNYSACNCKVEEPQSRFSVLKDLKLSD